jgi:hypothetical protein
MTLVVSPCFSGSWLKPNLLYRFEGEDARKKRVNVQEGHRGFAYKKNRINPDMSV